MQANIDDVLSNARKQKMLSQEVIQFSEKEIQIIRGICNELSNAEMTKQLYISRRTIDGYCSRILEKMNVKTAIGVVKYVIKNGLYTYCFFY